MKKVLVICHELGWEDRVISPRLESLGLAVDHVCARVGEIPPESAKDLAAIVSGGGSTPVSARADHPWMKREISLAADALARGTPFLGLCLGAQILAAALGVIAAPLTCAREERGYCAIIPQHRELEGLTHVFQWHYEAVALPPRAELLASGERFAVQGFRVGAAVGLQFHPDVQADRIEQWIAADPSSRTLEPGFVDRQRKLGARYDPTVTGWLDRFLPRWLGEAGDSG